VKYKSKIGNEDLSDYITDNEPIELNEAYDDQLGDYNFSADEEDE